MGISIASGCFIGYRSIAARGGTACGALILILEHPQDFKQRKNPRELASSSFVVSCRVSKINQPEPQALVMLQRESTLYLTAC